MGVSYVESIHKISIVMYLELYTHKLLCEKKILISWCSLYGLIFTCYQLEVLVVAFWWKTMFLPLEYRTPWVYSCHHIWLYYKWWISKTVHCCSYLCTLHTGWAARYQPCKICDKFYACLSTLITFCGRLVHYIFTIFRIYCISSQQQFITLDFSRS